MGATMGFASMAVCDCGCRRQALFLASVLGVKGRGD